MGVKACDRNACPSIMCERLVLNGSKYICNECYAELCEQKEKWPEHTRAVDVEGKIREFMDSPKQPMNFGYSVDEVFKRLTE